MARNLTKAVSVDGESFTVRQFNFGEFVDLMEAEHAAGDDTLANFKLQLDATMKALGVDQEKARAFSVPGLQGLYKELIAFSMQGVPESAEGKAESP